MKAAATQLTETQNNLMNALKAVEQQMELQSLYQRAKAIMAANGSIEEKSL